MLAGCGEGNPGSVPDADRIFFPQGVLLDPRTPPGESSRYLIVSSGNNDQAYNAGSLVAFDMDAFFASWAVDAEAGDLEVYPYCEVSPDADPDRFALGRCVRDARYAIDRAHPCRRLPLQPRVVECEEKFFAAGERQLIGNFATVMAASRSGGIPRLWIPVRGDPSITFAEIGPADPQLPPTFECGGGEGDRCDDAHRLRNLRNDDREAALEREPHNLVVEERDGNNYVYVAHTEVPTMTLIDIDGLRQTNGLKTGIPAIVDMASVFQPASEDAFPGGYGLAVRPCDPAAGPVPGTTQDCAWSMLYGSLRNTLALANFTVGARDPAHCTADECDPQVQAATLFPAIGLDLIVSPNGQLGEVAFHDDSGDLLYVLQTQPGGLLRVDTSLDARNVPRNRTLGPPLEICDSPSHLELWREQHLGFVSCFEAALLVAIDLQSFQVIDTVLTGTGPYDIALDQGRQVLYVTNTLESSVSVIHVDRRRPTFLKEVARLGLQEPFSQ